jgi:hypothetical protein
MAQLTANSPQVYTPPMVTSNSLPVAASTEIFLGSAVGLNTSTGYVRPLTAGDVFVGFAEQHVNNSAGAAGAMNVPLMREGRIQLAVSGAAVTDLNKAVYASDGATFTYTASGNTRIGTVVRWVSTGVVIVEFWTGTSKLITPITDSTGGTASSTLAAIAAGASYTQADMVAVKNAIASLALAVNQINQAGL